MSTLKGQYSFQEFLKTIRTDLRHIVSLYQSLVSKVNAGLTEETKEWIMDVFLDKVYEVNGKLNRFAGETKTSLSNASSAIGQIQEMATRLAFRNEDKTKNLKDLQDTINNYIYWVEYDLTHIRRTFHDSSWDKAEKIDIVRYATPERKRFLTAREELGTAITEVTEGRYENVLSHLRIAMDLAIKEKFGFKRITRMAEFFKDADEHNLPLPSYSLAYKYFDEGSARIHEGKIHTPFEAQEAIRFVSNFIDQLDLIEIDQTKIDEFRFESRSVQ